MIHRIQQLKTRQSLFLFGARGTGKSTLIDAIDFIFNKKAGSLKEKSSTNIKRHLPALGAKPQDIQISITSQNQESWNGKLNGEIPEITGSNSCLSVEILRRDKILKLINAEPKKRYDALKSFIELPYIRSSENSLRESIRSIEKNLTENIHTKEQQERTLKESWEGEGTPGGSFLKWAKEKSKKQDRELKEKIKRYDEFITKISQSINDI